VDADLVARCREEFEARLTAQEAEAAAAAAAVTAGGSKTAGSSGLASPSGPVSPAARSSAGASPAKASPLGTAAMHAAGAVAAGVHAHKAPAVRGSTSVTFTSDILPGSHHRGPVSGTEAGGPGTPKTRGDRQHMAFAMAMPGLGGEGDTE
jgi:hypothetical protein